MNSPLVAAGGVAPVVPATARSLVELLAARVAATPSRPALAAATGDGGLQSWTWADVAAAALRAAAALEGAGLRRGDRVVHLAPHAPDWIVVDLACLLAGVVHVPLHADAGAAEHRGQIGWLAPRAFVGGDGRATRGLTAADREGRGLVAAPPGGWLGAAGRGDPATVSAALADRVAGVDPDACCTIVLSSGTTGLPHGVLHSQRALAANAVAAAASFLDDPRDVRLAWLPASHLLARVGDLYTAVVRGGCLHIVGDRRRILDACRLLPPTVILGVPALFTRLESGVRSGRIADLAAALGGQVRACISGGAPLPRRTAEFFATRGVPLVEGYGLAEAGPVVSLANPRNARPGTVGPPLDGVEVRIDERPATRGQLLVRSPSRALGVIRPDGTEPSPAEVLGSDDWLETGDVATIDEAGQLTITGRIKEVVVLAGGVKFPPAEVERALAEDEAVAQVCVIGDASPWPVALVVPEPAAIRGAIRRLGLKVFSRAGAIGHPRLVRWLARRLARRQRHLPRAWRVRRVALVGRPFDVAHGEATESLKLRRGPIAEHFADTIAALTTEPAPAWCGVLDPSRPEVAAGVARPWLVPAVWQGDHGGFAEAAASAARPLASHVEAVLERVGAEIADLRAAGRLYDPPSTVCPPPPPLDDPLPAARGKFSAAAEATLGEAGLWGLAVPEAFGGSGATMLDLARSTTLLAADAPTAAGMLAVHSTIGAVSALAAFGSAEQRSRHLPGLAAGRPLSIFAATEPDAGCDLSRIRARLERRDGRLLLSGTKMFITGAIHGRLVKLVALHEGRPTVALVRLPDADTATFRLRPTPLHPLKHAHNAALEFDQFPLDDADLLAPPAGGDGMAIVWHGLNRGRTTLAAQAAGTLRLLLADAVAHARRRTTWDRPIAARQLVQGRLGRIAAAIAACDALTAWAAAAIDAGGGEWEAIVAKITASAAVREAAIDALGVHGGRAFLVGHPLGDALHDHFAVGVYEGESDLLGLALFRGIAKGHPLAAQGVGGLRRAGGWLAWRASAWSRVGHGQDGAILDRRLRAHATAARRRLAGVALAIDRAIRRHGRGLAERQLEIGRLATDIRDLAGILATAHHADASGDEAAVAAAEAWCGGAHRRVAVRRPTPADLAGLARLGANATGEPTGR